MPKIDHVGIAVNSVDAAASLLESLLGQPPDGGQTVPEEGVRVVFFGSGPGRIELLEATNPDSPLARFLRRRGPGLHHICLRVPDLHATLDRARSNGLEIVPPGAREGADGRTVAFLHPRSTGGVLIELSEFPDPSSRTVGPAAERPAEPHGPLPGEPPGP
ncbi:MAG: methylmalonyl-CoA epimerase [Gemmatimonadota bacterium]